MPADAVAIVHAIVAFTIRAFDAGICPGQTAMSATDPAIVADVLDALSNAAAPPDPRCRCQGAGPHVAAHVPMGDAVDDRFHDRAIATILDMAQRRSTEDARCRMHPQAVRRRPVWDLSSGQDIWDRL